MKMAELDRALEEDGRVLLWHRRLLALAEIEAEAAPEREAERRAEAAAEAHDARMAAQGWRGGRCDPLDSCFFENDPEELAAAGFPVRSTA
jgi:hypothetical protein